MMERPRSSAWLAPGLFLMHPAMASSPYQPSLLRLLHGLTALLAGLAWLTGLVLLLGVDGRWGRLPLPFGSEADRWIDLHGTTGVLLLVPAALFVLYALSLGWRRLRTWTNLVPLLALILAIGSGKLMNEDWLREGTLQHPVYAVHLLAWCLLLLMVLVHLGGLWRRGGWPLLRSIASPGWRPGDGPVHWPAQLGRWWQQR